jgi:hypothetical protein
MATRARLAAKLAARKREQLQSADQNERLARVMDLLAHQPPATPPHQPLPHAELLFAQAATCILVPNGARSIGILASRDEEPFTELAYLTMEAHAAAGVLHSGIREQLEPIFARAVLKVRTTATDDGESKQTPPPAGGTEQSLSLLQVLVLSGDVRTYVLGTAETAQPRPRPLVCCVTGEADPDRLCDLVLLFVAGQSEHIVVPLHRGLAAILMALHTVGTFSRVMRSAMQQWCQEKGENTLPAEDDAEKRHALVRTTFLRLLQLGTAEWKSGVYQGFLNAFDNSRGFLEWLGGELEPAGPLPKLYTSGGSGGQSLPLAAAAAAAAETATVEDVTEQTSSMSITHGD